MTAKRGRGEAQSAAAESDALPTSEKRQKRVGAESNKASADGATTAQDAPKMNESGPQMAASSGGPHAPSVSPQTAQPPVAAVSIPERASEADAQTTSSDDEPLLPARGAGGAGIKLGSECPYLDTVNRQVRCQTLMCVSKPIPLVTHDACRSGGTSNDRAFC